MTRRPFHSPAVAPSTLLSASRAGRDHCGCAAMIAGRLSFAIAGGR